MPDAKEAGVHRGMVAAAPEMFGGGDAVDVELTLTPRSPKLEHRVPIRFHTGTVEVLGQLLLLDRNQVASGDQFVARLELDEPVACHAGDRFLLRLQNPVVTVGGGRILRLEESGRYRRKELGSELQGIVDAGDKPEARVLHELEQAGPVGCPVDDLARALGVEEGKVVELLGGIPETELYDKGMRVFLRQQVFDGEQELLTSVDKILARRPAAASIQRSAIRTTRTLPQQLIEFVFSKLQDAGRVRAGRQGQILFLERLKPLPAEQQAQFDKIVSECETRAFRPPTLDELSGVVGLRGDALLSLLDRAQDEAKLDKVGDHFYGASVVRSVLHRIRDNCLANDEVLDIPSLRDGLDTSRKFLIPLLEYVDSLGLTVLRGGVRRLLPSSAISRELAAEQG